MDELKKVFSSIYEQNLWRGPESRSGYGSGHASTVNIRNELPIIFKKFNITSMLDIPCGDFNWMREVNLNGVKYIGADIVTAMIQDNKEKIANGTWLPEFVELDLTTSDLPKVDLIFVRDCLGHLNNENTFKALNNIKRSGSKYLLTTSFTRQGPNVEVLNGHFRCINLLIEPFRFNPIYLVNENCIEGYPHFNDKCMILFEIDKLPQLNLSK